MPNLTDLGVGGSALFVFAFWPSASFTHAKEAYSPEEKSHRGSVRRNKVRCSRADVAPRLGAGFEAGQIDRFP